MLNIGPVLDRQSDFWTMVTGNQTLEVNFYFFIYFFGKRNLTTQFLGNTYHQGPGRSLYPGRRWHHFHLTRKIHHTGRFQTEEQKKLQGSGKLVHHPQGKKKNTECTIHRLGEVNKTQVKLTWEGEQQERGWWTGTEVKGNNELRLKMTTTESWKTENQHWRTCKTHKTPHLRCHYFTGGAKLWAQRKWRPILR